MLVQSKIRLRPERPIERIDCLSVKAIAPGRNWRALDTIVQVQQYDHQLGQVNNALSIVVVHTDMCNYVIHVHAYRYLFF
jgi:hypothetical protein